MGLRAVLLGTGVIAGQHALALRALEGAVELVAVCDIDPIKGEAFRKTWSVAEYYRDLDAMLERLKPEVVHVLLPPAAHARAVIECLERGCDVFVEKPFCVSSEECRSVLQVAESHGRQIGVDHNLIFMPVLVEAMREIDKGRLGRVRHVTVMYQLPMDGLTEWRQEHWMFAKPEHIVLELGPHPISVIYRILGEIESASAIVSRERVLENGELFFESWQASFLCRGGTAQLLLGRAEGYPNAWVHILGERGGALADLRRDVLRVSESTRYSRAEHLLDGWKNGSRWIGRSTRNFARQAAGRLGLGRMYDTQALSIQASIRAFYEALMAGKRVPVSGEDGAAVVRVCEDVIRGAMEFRSASGRDASVRR